MFFNAKLLLLACSLTVVLALPVADDEVPTLGGVTKVSADDLKNAETELKSSLAKISAGEGPHYEIGEVHSATTQVVAGSLTKLNVDLINSNKEKKNCNVDIWSRSWLPNGIEVTIQCEGEEKVVRKHSA